MHGTNTLKNQKLGIDHIIDIPQILKVIFPFLNEISKVIQSIYKERH